MRGKRLSTHRQREHYGGRPVRRTTPKRKRRAETSEKHFVSCQAKDNNNIRKRQRERKLDLQENKSTDNRRKRCHPQAARQPKTTSVGNSSKRGTASRTHRAVADSTQSSELGDERTTPTPTAAT